MHYVICACVCAHACAYVCAGVCACCSYSCQCIKIWCVKKGLVSNSRSMGPVSLLRVDRGGVDGGGWGQALCSCWLPEQTWHPCWSSYQFVIWAPVTANDVSSGQFAEASLHLSSCGWCHIHVQLWKTISLTDNNTVVGYKLTFSFEWKKIYITDWRNAPLIKCCFTCYDNVSSSNLHTYIEFNFRGSGECGAHPPSPSVTIGLICLNQQLLLLKPLHLLITLLI